MGSRAFGAVARAVLFALASPEDEDIKLLGQPKNNLGRSDLPTITYRIDGVKVADHGEGEIWTGHIDWLGETELSIADALASAGTAPDSKTAVKDAEEWLSDHLTGTGGRAPSAAIKESGTAAGHAERTLQRARKSLHLVTVSDGSPRQTFWQFPTEAADGP